MSDTPRRPAAGNALHGVWLPDMASTAGHLIRRAEQVHTALWFAEIPNGLTLPQYAVLLVLAGQPRIDQRRLGDHASLDKSTAADVLSRLIRQGLVGRLRDPLDGRRNLLQLTRAGQAALTAITPRVLRVQQRVLAPLPAADRPRLVELLARIGDAHPAAARPAPVPRPARETPSAPGTPPDLATLPGQVIRRAQQVKTAVWLEEVGTDLTSPQFVTLLEVAKAPGVDQQSVGAKSSLDKATMTDVIVRLERRGLVKRVRDSWDRRRSVLELTPHGEQALAEVLPVVVAMNERLLAPLDPAERPVWTRLCQAVVFRDQPAPATGHAALPGDARGVLDGGPVTQYGPTTDRSYTN